MASSLPTTAQPPASTTAQQSPVSGGCSNSCWLQLTDVTKSFTNDNGHVITALQALNLELQADQHLVALIGPDGSGKSTLLKILAGLMEHDAGTYTLYLHGPDSADAAPLIGYMSQTLGLYEDVSVWENLLLFSQLRDLRVEKLTALLHSNATGESTETPASPTSTTSPSSTPETAAVTAAKPKTNAPASAHAVAAAAPSLWLRLRQFFSPSRPMASSADTNSQQLQEYLDQLLTQVGLIAFKDYRAGALSGGMKQKLALTCALSAQPQLLLLDEPTVGVDPISRRELWAIIEQYLQRTHSYCIFSSLYLEEAERSDHTVFIKEGQIIYHGSAQTLKEQVRSQCWALTLSDKWSYQELARKLMIHKSQCQLLRDVCPRMGRIDLLTDPDCTANAVQAEVERLLTACGFTLQRGDVQLTAREPILEDAYINLTGSFHAQQGFTELLGKSTSPEAPEATATTATDTAASKATASNSTDTANRTAATTTAANAKATAAAYAAPEEAVIKVKDIRKQFGDFTAVHDSTFEVYQGEIFGLLGPNGAGKTTTFRMICALLNPSSGSILINGLSLAHAKSSVRATIGYVAQKFCLYRKLTLEQNLQYFGKSYGLSGELLEERMAQMCSVFGLTPFLHEMAANLPFGVQRSLSMACALIHRPQILFLDEATSGADPASRRAFWQMIASLAEQGTTIIVTTHFMEEAEYCDRFLIQDQGKILILGTPDEICTRPDHSRISIEEAFVACVQQRRHQQK